MYKTYRAPPPGSSDDCVRWPTCGGEGWSGGAGGAGGSAAADWGGGGPDPGGGPPGSGRSCPDRSTAGGGKPVGWFALIMSSIGACMGPLPNAGADMK